MTALADHPDAISDAELWAAVDLQRDGLEGVREAVTREDWPAAAEAWAAHFRARETPTMHFHRDAWPAWIREHRPQLVAPIIAEADEIVAGRITHDPFVLRVEDREIEWLENPTRDTNYVSVVGSQWFLNCLGRAYLLTGDDRYAEAFAWIFGSWFDHQQDIRAQQGDLGFDPIFRAYYPGVRARVLSDCYYCLAQSDALTPELHVKLLKALLGAAAWLYAQNDPAYQVGNQQVAAVLGCGVVGLVFPEFRDAEAWVELCEERMIEHMQDDFFADGGHRELCTQYHKTVLRDVGYVALISEANGRESLFSDPDAGPQIERAYEWLARLIMPTGETPALHSAVFATDWAVHLELGARQFGRGDFAWLAERYWRRGEVPSQKPPFALANYMIAEARPLPPGPPPPGNAHDAFQAGEGGERLTAPDWLSVHLEESGFAVMRTGWEAEDRYLLVQHGWANTGHAYPGALHFIYAANGELVASSPGSPRSYRDAAYPYCHSTPSHNVVTIDNASYPGRPSPGGHAELVEDLPGAWLFAGYHEGYRKVARITISREVLAIKDGPLLFRDQVEGGMGREAQWNFHSPLQMRVSADRSAELVGRARYRLVAAWPDEIPRATVERRWHTILPRDCQPEDCGDEVNVLRWPKRIGESGARFGVALFEDDGAIEPLGDDGFRLTSGPREWIVLFGEARRRMQVPGIVAQARCACVELRAGEPVRGWVFRGTRLVVNDLVWLSAQGPVTREVGPPVV
ncbi:MAG: hypothetical protein GX131_16620 [candidate division WS1 bacterium]|nr:hypothetical protein [candidate division WS1 bacterium]